jgi:hypothetical protein
MVISDLIINAGNIFDFGTKLYAYLSNDKELVVRDVLDSKIQAAVMNLENLEYFADKKAAISRVITHLYEAYLLYDRKIGNYEYDAYKSGLFWNTKKRENQVYMRTVIAVLIAVCHYAMGDSQSLVYDWLVEKTYLLNPIHPDVPPVIDYDTRIGFITKKDVSILIGTSESERILSLFEQSREKYSARLEQVWESIENDMYVDSHYP